MHQYGTKVIMAVSRLRQFLINKKEKGSINNHPILTNG